MLTTAIFLSLLPAPSVKAQDANIEKLLKKLPPPESLVSRPPADALAEVEVLGDENTSKLAYALRYRQTKRAIEFADLLVQRHPKNPWVHCIRASLAVTQNDLAKGFASFRESTRVQSNFAYGYLEMGAVEVIQHHYAAAIPHFKKVLPIWHESPLTLVFLSGCEEKIGHREQALEYAKRAVAAESDAPGTWLRLAAAENAMGHVEKARQAMTNAQKLLASRRWG